jgi:ABC-2 type transport system permease protein
MEIDKIKKTILQIFAMVELEFRRVSHDPTEMVTRAIQPILWLVVFGGVMARAGVFWNIIKSDYITYVTPGVILQSATFIALAYGIMLVFERESGLLKRLLASPISRLNIIVGRSLAGAIRGSIQYLIIIPLAFLIGAHLTPSLINLTLGYIFITYGLIGFTSISIAIASILKTRERFMGIIGAITMPLFFASNALYPIEVMPGWVKVIADYNPLTYIISGLRNLLVYDSLNIIFDFFALTIFNFIAVFLAAISLHRIIE